MNPKHYKVFNGAYYHTDTPDDLIRVLEVARATRQRVCIAYGDTQTGELWGDVATGYISRSMGPCQIPLVIYNRRSIGGEGILTDCVLSVSTSRGKRLIYTHKEVPE